MAASTAAGLCVGAALHAMTRADTADALRADGVRLASLPAPAQTANCSVMLFGDSILYGAHNGVQRLADPPAAMLQRLRPRYAVMDHSHPGDSAHLHAPRFKRTPLRGRIVVLQFGINDAGQDYPDYERAMRAMVRRVRAQGLVPLITGLSHVSEGQAGRDAYDRSARRVAHSTGTAFADWGAVHFDTADMADAVHPGQPYAARLTQQLVRALDRVAPECAQPVHAEAPLRLMALHRAGSGRGVDANDAADTADAFGAATALAVAAPLVADDAENAEEAPRDLPLVAGAANSLRLR